MHVYLTIHGQVFILRQSSRMEDAPPPHFVLCQGWRWCFFSCLWINLIEPLAPTVKLEQETFLWQLIK